MEFEAARRNKLIKGLHTRSVPDDQTLGPAADILSAGFVDDPVVDYLFPSPDLKQALFELSIKHVYAPKGTVYVDNSGGAAALWLPPETVYKMPFAMSVSLALKFLGHGIKGAAMLQNAMKARQTYGQHMPSEPHYYIQYIGCAPSKRGQGLGSQLLDHFVSICDRDSSAAYLECTSESALPLYQRFGFEVQDMACFVDQGPKTWFMLRPNRKR